MVTSPTGVKWAVTTSVSLPAPVTLPPALTVCGLILPWLGAPELHWGASLAILLGSWVILCGLVDLRDKLRHAPNLRRGLKRLSAGYYGMQLGHLGLAVATIGVGLVSAYGIERDIRMEPGVAVDVGGYQFEWLGSGPLRGPNYVSEQGRVRVSRNAREMTVLLPEKRRYLAQGEQLMTEAAIDPGLWRDLYVAMGEPLGDDAWAVRVQVKPFVRWIWGGALLMALGGVLAAADRRYRSRVRSRAAPRVSTSTAVQS